LKTVKKILKILGIFIISLISLALIAIAIILFKPSLIINEPNFKWAAEKLKSYGLDATWKSATVNIHSDSFYDKRLTLKFHDLCLLTSDDEKNPSFLSVSLNGCFEDLDILISFSFKDLKPHIIEAGPIKIWSEKLAIGIKPSPPKKIVKKKSDLFSKLITSETIVHDIDIKFSDLGVHLKNDHLKVRFKLSDEGTMGKSKPWTLHSHINLTESGKKLNVTARSIITGENLLLKAPLDASSHITFSLGEKLKAVLHINYAFKDREKGHYAVSVKATQSDPTSRKPKDSEISFGGKISGDLDQVQTIGSLAGNLIYQGNEVSLGEKKTCAYNVRFSHDVRLNCPIDVLPTTHVFNGVNFKDDFEAIHLWLKAQFDSDQNGYWDGDAGLEIKTDHDRVMSIVGDVKAVLNKSMLDGTLVDHLNVKSNLKIAINRFQDLVLKLKRSALAVPAPLNVLSGHIFCDLKGDLNVQQAKVPFECETALSSKFEALFMKITGAFGLKKQENVKTPTGETSSKYKPDLVATVFFNNVQLALPHFGMQGPPPIIPDSRIKKNLFAAKPATSLPLSYDITLQTPKGKPLRILSNLAKSPIPVGIDISLVSDKAIGGSIEIQEFPVDLFRRHATLKFFNIRMKENGDDLIQGRIEVKYTDYLIRVNVDGTFKEPVVRFESVPPLSQSEIISVLLFGRKLDDSNTDQSSSVASTQAALADRALALSSMYILAATPVESVGYNSQSQTFTAKIHLAEGTSLNVGAGESGVKEVGVNRHLGGPWYIYTYLRNPSTSVSRSTAAFLEWVLRY
jgi:hypothetical protein